MKIQYKTALLFVKDVSKSRSFYENTLQQKVMYDFGEDVVFESGFAIHDANHISKLLFNRPNPNMQEKLGRENFELYFECDDLDAVFSELVSLGAEILHNIREHPWGQRAFRLFDPDYHIVEVGEPMEIVIKRYLIQGLSEGEVAAKTSMPIEEIRRINSRMDKGN